MEEITNIKEVQHILFDALCYLDDFCREHGIRYYLSNGTLLGAVKYRQFIPWDDDVDVMMPRADYDRFVSMTDVSCADYRLLCLEQVPQWRMPYAKLSCEKTLLREGEYFFGEEFGLSVDIFPIDNWSTHRFVAKMQALKGEICKRLLVCSIGGAFATEKKGVKRLILKTIWLAGKTIGSERILKTILNSVKKAKKRPAKYVGCVSWTCHLSQEILPGDILDETAEVSFCGRRFPAFSQYELYLNRLYGNWKEELPPDRQHSNHSIRVWRKDAE